MFSHLTHAIASLAGAVRKLAGVLETEPDLPMAERGVADLRMAMGTESAGGVDGMSLAVAMNDRQWWKFKLIPAVKDADGKQFKTADGVPLTPDMVPVTVAASDETVTPLTEVAADGKSGKILSGDPGASEVTFTVGPYPDGSSKTLAVQFAVGFSEPGEPEVEGVVEDETPA